MRTLLKIFPRTILIRISFLIRPLLVLLYKGSKFTDPIDGRGYRKFFSYGHQTLRPNALSPGTLSLERHRLLWLYLQSIIDIENQELDVLHIAPEQIFYKKFRKYSHWNYTTLDIQSPIADIKADLCNLPLKDNCYNLILCNHVLEHIDDDKKAMMEIYRVLKPGGIAILQVPIDYNRNKTFEDFSITSPKKRTEFFGQYDHVRIYGIDFFKRLSEIGFKIKKIDFTSNLSDKEIKRFGLIKGELIPVGEK
ncbi:MAG: SAM-dependent methyltransferase [Flavobacteriaceae bacterium]|nr:SAM-dependent methyltransferase [Flavobacteriaceae bacterium]|tara:strand:+ start:28014 stop:28766 length:753 start_codon:yes stop_codon:yes gene_type:complete